MKRFFRALFVAAAVATAACGPCERTVVLLSTNDIHANILRFPQLAAAVGACRDTADLVLLLDAGDRWTGEAYVDRAPVPGMPVVALMNRLGYDAATLGNHEFDHGQAFLGRMIDSMEFAVVCANVVSDTCTFPQLPPYAVVERGGLKIGVVGVVTNYEGPGHPAGKRSSFEGLEFPDPQQAAIRWAEALRPEVDLLVLVSHMGDERDAELLAREGRYDVVIGGHTHELRDTVVNGTLLTQTGKKLANVGVTKIRMRGKKVAGIDYELVPLDAYAPDAEFQRQVDGYFADPVLSEPAGTFARTADKAGLANWMASSLAADAKADIGIYHIGGVRLDGIDAGDVTKGRIYNLEPFGTLIATMRMTPAQLRGMILTKYNEQTREGHRIDLIATVPYTVVTDAQDRAVDVLFPTLREGKKYRIAITDYVFTNYDGLAYDDGVVTKRAVADVLLERLKSGGPVEPDNRPLQGTVVAETVRP